MTKMRISLMSIDDVKSFTAIMNDTPFESGIISGSYVVDAKSIMGIFSLDLGRPLDLAIQSDDCGDLPEKLERFMA